MIEIGELGDQKLADNITHQLNKEGIAHQFSITENGKFILYIHNESDYERAMHIYRTMLRLPPVFNIPSDWIKLRQLKMGPITRSFVVFSIALYLLDFFDDSLKNSLLFATSHRELFFEIKNGEPWRLITPIFLHFHFLHILFNALCFKDFGKMMEHTKGSPYFLLFILVVGVLSNTAQYLVAGPFFGGLSGVVFGLLGYIWMHKQFDQSFEFSLPKSEVVMMIVFFILCITGLVPRIANMAHAVGLSMGMIWGIIQGISISSKKKQVINYQQGLLYTALAILFFGATTLLEYLKLKEQFYYKLHHFLS